MTQAVDSASGSSVIYLADREIDAGAVETLSNTATVSSSLPDPDSAENSTTDAEPPGAFADLQVTATLTPDPAGLGDLVAIEVTVSNAGPSDAEAVTLTSMLPAGLALDSTLGCAEDRRQPAPSVDPCQRRTASS